MRKAMFTSAELEEMAAWDAICDAEPLTEQEICESRRRDRDAVLSEMNHRQRQIAEQKRQYRERNREQIAEQQRQYYERNREQIAEQKRQYYERKKAYYALTV